MTSEPDRILFHTEGCHLCELAQAILSAVALTRGWRVQLVDIADDDALLERYGTRIPVVRDPRDGREIGWPFDRDALERELA